MNSNTKETDPDEVKSCCTNFYEMDIVANVLGQNFHPGGVPLTLHLGKTLGLNENSKVLDVACGPGASALALVKEFGCSVTGIDLSDKNLHKARERAVENNFTDKLEFIRSDAEQLEVPDESFDAVICECALCTFPDKDTAVNEMFRVLKKGGKVGITDVTLDGKLPENLDNLVSRVLCIAGALTADGYQNILREKGFNNVAFENQSDAIKEIIERSNRLLKGWKMVEKMFNFDLQKLFGITPEEAKGLVDIAFEEVDKGTIGYGMFTAEK